MLSYLKDDRDGQDKHQRSGDEQSDHVNQDQVGQDEYLMPSGNTTLARQGTMILIALFVVGAGAVFFMVKKVVPAQAEAADTTQHTKIESSIAKLNGIQTKMNGKLDQVAEKIYNLSNVKQLGEDDLLKNPFVHKTTSSFGVEKEIVNTKKEVKNINVKLWSIMESDQGRCCMINNKLLYEGDRIQGMTVVAIGKKTVQLQSEQGTILLRIAQ